MVAVSYGPSALLPPCPHSLHPSSSPATPPSPTSLLTALKSCTSARHLHLLHANAIKTELIRDVLVAGEILRLSAVSGYRDLPYARRVFDAMREPNLFSWNTIIRAFCEGDDIEEPLEALLLYCEMLHQESVKPNRHTLPSVLKACAKIAGIEEGKQVHSHAVKLGIGFVGFVVTNLARMYASCGCMENAHKLACRSSELVGDEARVILCNVLIDGFFKLGMAEHARQVFDDMPQRSTISWNTMVSGYAQMRLHKEAIDILLQMMEEEGLVPNYITLVSALPAISAIGALEFGERIHSYAEVNKFTVDDVLGSALVDMYSKCGNLDKAIELFEGLPKRNPITWSAIIGGLALHGRTEDAFGYLRKMELGEVFPTDTIFISLLNACSHTRKVDDGRRCFQDMVNKYGLKPRVEHFGCMIDMLGRAGFLEEAEEIVKRMPADLPPDNTVLKSLLASCRTHGNVEIGTRVAKQLTELAPHDGGACVLASNMFASVGDWEAMAKVRLTMKEMHIRKDPGCSWIMVDGFIHVFIVEDNSHAMNKEIYAVLESLSDQTCEA